MNHHARFVRICHADGDCLPLRVRRCDTLLCRFRGLMLRRALAPDEGLLFVEQMESKLATSIHMFFVFFSIGVVWMNAEGTVVDAQLAKPFHPYYAPHAPAKYYLEASPALLDWVKVGEKLSIENS
ncbi:MAG: DUF192 domain-containing protein [Anaerolineae bacterium]|nr:DUF192 domain-containing protein [Anaerolineae bacterium]